MSTDDVIVLAKTLAKLEAAWDLLADVWNQSLSSDLREAIGQDGMKPMMCQLKVQADYLRMKLRAACPAEEGGG